MEPDATIRLSKEHHEAEDHGKEDLSSHAQNPAPAAPDDPERESPRLESQAEIASEIPEPETQPSGIGARFRKLIESSRTGEEKRSDKRKQLREDRTKTFMMLAGALVIMALVFFGLFSSPGSSSRKTNNTRANQPNLGRVPGGEDTADTGHSVTPLLNADTRKPDENSGAVTPEDIRNTAKLRPQTQAANTQTPAGNTSTASAVAHKAEPKDYALNKIDFPSEPGYVPPTQALPGQGISSPAQPATPLRVAKASMVFVRSATGTRDMTSVSTVQQPSVGQVAILQQTPDFNALPAGARLVARLETPVSSALKSPVVAAIEYNYERDGEIVIPAGTKAFGELEQANEHGVVGIHFTAIQMPDQGMQRIDGRAMSLRYEPMRGNVTGRNTGKRFLVRAMTGVGTIAAATIGVRTGTGLSEPITNNALLRERVANNVAIGGEQQLAETAYHQNIVVTVPGNTRFYLVLAKPTGNFAGGTPAPPPIPANDPRTQSFSAASQTSPQELRELMELKRELTRMYQQPPRTSVEQTSAPQQ